MTLGKHFINDVDDPVLPALKSLLVNDASLRLISDKKIIFRQHSSKKPKVVLISGGGSGHEPAHAGYVGEGMLDISVAGNIFASPSASQILAGIESVESPLGILQIVKNYTGDKLNFGLAAAKAKTKGYNVKTVFTADDVSIKDNELVGNRGLAGVVFVHKIAGAAAINGYDLEKVTEIAQRTSDSIFTVAASLDKCSIPHRTGQDGLAVDVIEFGMGIHNETGAERVKLTSMTDIVSKLLKSLLDDGRETDLKSSNVAVLINNLGGLSVLELHTLADEILGQLSKKILNISRVFIGTFVTSLDGPGVSITLLKLDSELESLLDQPTRVNAWPKKVCAYTSSDVEKQIIKYVPKDDLADSKAVSTLTKTVSKDFMISVIEKVVLSVEKDEPSITKYDTLAGDGDCGTTLLSGVKALQANFQSFESKIDVGSTFKVIATTVEEAMGGTSGAIYAIFFNAVATSIRNDSENDDDSDSSDRKLLQNALKNGLEELYLYTGARVGHRTLMDALIPFVQNYSKNGNFEKSLKSASEGAESTRKMVASFGRASYVTKEQLEKDGGIPDPGALGVVSILKGISEALK